MITLFIFEAECFLRPTKKPYCLFFSLYFIFKKSSWTLSIYLYIIILLMNVSNVSITNKVYSNRFCVIYKCTVRIIQMKYIKLI